LLSSASSMRSPSRIVPFFEPRSRATHWLPTLRISRCSEDIQASSTSMASRSVPTEWTARRTPRFKRICSSPVSRQRAGPASGRSHSKSRLRYAPRRTGRRRAASTCDSVSPFRGTAPNATPNGRVDTQRPCHSPVFPQDLPIWETRNCLVLTWHGACSAPVAGPQGGHLR
jgi:hypothetical protein